MTGQDARSSSTAWRAAGVVRVWLGLATNATVWPSMRHGELADRIEREIDAAVAEAVKEWRDAAGTETPSGLATRIADLEANIRRRNRD